MSVQHFIVATAGHVDHGKSALVKALTGTDPDRLPEEKARGITIDLGFAHLELPSSGGADSRFHLGIVDVPGHEDFVKNMVAGVGSIDLALFVVAADDGWMPQTEEHLQILTYLGVRRAVIALTKIDLVKSAEEDSVAALRARLRETPFESAPIVKTSVMTNRGLDELKSALADVLTVTPSPRDIGKPRLPVDRVFSLHGIGTVVTGTLNGGTLQRGQTVVVQPSGQGTRIRSLQTHNRDVPSAAPGTRAALNLPDLAIAGKSEGKGLHRGEVISLPELGGPSETMDVLLEKSARLENGKGGAGRPLKNGTLVRMHHGSGNSPARVLLIDSEPLVAGQSALAQLRFEAPVFAFAGDRFILRDWSEQLTLAGGTVLDPDAARKNLRGALQRKFLEHRAQSPEEPRLFAASQLARDGIVRRSGLLLKSRFSSEEISQAVSALVAEKLAVAPGDWAADATWWMTRLEKAAGAVQAGHRAHPERAGLPLSELRRSMGNQLPSEEVFALLVGELCRTDFAQTGVAIRHRQHRPALPAHLQAAGSSLRASLAAKPLEPPSRKELAPDAVSQQALRFLIETGEATDLGKELVLAAESFSRASEAIKEFIREKGPATVSDLRQLLQTSRRIMIPLLEKLDRDGVTVRQGDRRALKNR